MLTLENAQKTLKTPKQVSFTPSAKVWEYLQSHAGLRERSALTNALLEYAIAHSAPQPDNGIAAAVVALHRIAAAVERRGVE